MVVDHLDTVFENGEVDYQNRQKIMQNLQQLCNSHLKIEQVPEHEHLVMQYFDVAQLSFTDAVQKINQKITAMKHKEVQIQQNTDVQKLAQYTTEKQQLEQHITAQKFLMFFMKKADYNQLILASQECHKGSASKAAEYAQTHTAPGQFAYRFVLKQLYDLCCYSCEAFDPQANRAMFGLMNSAYKARNTDEYRSMF